MLGSRARRRVAIGRRAVNWLAEIEAPVAALEDDHLLDLADIFGGDAAKLVKEIASARDRARPGRAGQLRVKRTPSPRVIDVDDQYADVDGVRKLYDATSV